MIRGGKLSDVRVAETVTHRTGPFCSALLAGLDAEVIRIGRPDVGDPARTRGVVPEKKSPPFTPNTEFDEEFRTRNGMGDTETDEGGE